MTKTRLAAIAAAIFVVALCAAQPALAGPTSPTTAIVALGDSFSSGEAGRWQGNSLNFTGTRDGTDRAARCTLGIFCSYDATRVYGSSYANGCHRADVAPIRSAAISVNERINLACSGAQTRNIWRASQGGSSFKGEVPQADQLAPIAQQKNVKLVLLNITANDLGFSDHVINCTVAWTLGYLCNPSEQAAIVAGLPAAANGLRKSIDEVRAVMSGAGYSPSQWKFVIQGYASPVPVAANIRYSGFDRLAIGGCPFNDADADWAKNTATPTIVDNMRGVAQEKGVRFLDVRDSLNGHEVCHKSSKLVTSSPSPVQHEWVRWLNSGCCQGDAQESLHPNAYGEKAIGKCIALIYGTSSGNYSCRNTPGGDFNAMSLVSIP
jgi:GDSL-like Lipase/Acylhydrolase family